MSQAVRSHKDGICLDVLVVPRASRSEIVGLHEDRLKIRLAAPPVDGEANDELCRMLARLLHVPQRAVEIVRGATGRRKQVLVKGISLETARAVLIRVLKNEL